MPDDIDRIDILWSSGDDRVKKSSQPLLHQRGPRLGAASSSTITASDRPCKL